MKSSRNTKPEPTEVSIGNVVIGGQQTVVIAGPCAVESHDHLRVSIPGGKAEVIVPDYQLSLAIGREGQNARLAARLTGWRIDIRPDTQPD